MDTLRHICYLVVRNLKIRFKRPSTVLPPILISAFLFLAFGYAFAQVTKLPGFPAENYLAFLTPFILLQAMVFSSGDAGFGILTDILSGYFDKLLLTPINRFAILFSSLFTASIRALVQTALIVILALALGVSFKTGPLGVFVVIWFVATFGVAWACLGIAIALKTKSAEITQSYFVLFFPAVFLTTGFMPKEFLPGWFSVMASINPVTYVMESTRAMVVQGWDGSTILPGLLVLIGLTGGLMGITTWLFHRATV